jgi:hypothetical protein
MTAAKRPASGGVLCRLLGHEPGHIGEGERPLPFGAIVTQRLTAPVTPAGVGSPSLVLQSSAVCEPSACVRGCRSRVSEVDDHVRRKLIRM